MTCPRLLPSAALLFWGWQADAPIAAALLLVLIAPAGKIPWRWNVTTSQFQRIGDLTAVLFLGAVAYFTMTVMDNLPIYYLLRWLPVLFAPLLLAQIYSHADTLPLSALLYSRRFGDGRVPANIDFRLPYALVCILAAGSRGSGTAIYFAGAGVAVLWTLWRNRSRRLPDGMWLLWFALALVLGYYSQIGLSRLQGRVEEWTVDWFSAWQPDPFKARTAIGDVGNLKLSGRILFRVKSERPLLTPLLLHEVTYDRYAGQTWEASRAAFSSFPIPTGNGPQTITVLQRYAQRSAILALPMGWSGLHGLNTANLERNRLGAVKWMDVPPLAFFRVDYDPETLDRTEPTSEDTRVPQAIRTLLHPLVEQLGLRALRPSERVAALERFFGEQFAYSLELGRKAGDAEALRNFLYRRRAGHCEYFASATALLLRATGVPARYAVGFSVQEFSDSENTYLVRRRHAHAWTQAYINGGWRTLDFTPARWAEEEAARDSWWQPISDMGSRWALAFQEWRWHRSQGDETSMAAWNWAAPPLVLWLGWSLYRSRQRTALTTAKSPRVTGLTETDYDRLERQLLTAGHAPRDPGETPLCWLRRIGAREHVPVILNHYRQRFGRHNERDLASEP